MQIRHSTHANVEIDHAFYSYDSVNRPLTKHTSTGLASYSYDIRDFLVTEYLPASGFVSALVCLPFADAMVADADYTSWSFGMGNTLGVNKVTTPSGTTADRWICGGKRLTILLTARR